MKIRNKVTGEIKEVTPQELPTYGLGVQSPISSLSQPLTQSSMGVSDVPAAAGQFVGSLAGTAGGPIGRIAGGAVGAGVGQEVAQAQAGESGDPGALLSFLPPVDFVRRLKKGASTEKSPTEKAMMTGAASQATGEGLAMGVKVLLNPIKFFGDVIDKINSKATKTLEGTTIKDRFFNEVVPNVIKTRGKEVPVTHTALKIAEEEPELFSARGGPLGRWFTAPELNEFRKKFNQSFSDSPQIMKSLEYGLAKLLKEEQLKLAPAAGKVITAQKALFNIQDLLKSVPLGAGNTILKALEIFSKPVSSLGQKFGQYGVGPLVQAGVNKNKK